MYEWEVKTKNGTSIYVLAENWKKLGTTIYFYQHKRVVKQIPEFAIQSIQRTYPEPGELTTPPFDHS